MGSNNSILRLMRDRISESEIIILLFIDNVSVEYQIENFQNWIFGFFNNKSFHIDHSASSQSLKFFYLLIKLLCFPQVDSQPRWPPSHVNPQPMTSLNLPQSIGASRQSAVPLIAGQRVYPSLCSSSTVKIYDCMSYDGVREASLPIWWVLHMLSFHYTGKLPSGVQL